MANSTKYASLHRHLRMVLGFISLREYVYCKDKKNNDTLEKKIITFLLIKIIVKGIKCYLFA